MPAQASVSKVVRTLRVQTQHLNVPPQSPRVSFQFAKQPELRESPIALDRIGRDVEHFSRFLDTQSSKEPHFDDTGLPRIGRSQNVQRVIYCEQLDCRTWRHQDRFVQSHSPRITTTFLVPARPRMIDEHAPHESRRDAEKVRPVLPPKPPCAGQPQKRFVDQRCRLQGVIAPFAAHVRAGQAAQLRLDERQQPLERTRIPSAPPMQQLRDCPG